MREKMYGEKTIERLRDSGYSNRAIGDITLISEKYRARPSAVESLFQEGYTPKQVDEIYAASREYHIGSLKHLKKFYGYFRNHSGSLSSKVGKINDAILNSGVKWEYFLPETLSIAQGLSILNKWGVDEIAEHIKGPEKDRSKLVYEERTLDWNEVNEDDERFYDGEVDYSLARDSLREALD